ncbi:hypothetical protein [Roseivirga sp.]|uniref:hypothetical protein n=1 Tax=Roseivirga sp. TaxID=1964215 RepID=UPI003B524AED
MQLFKSTVFFSISAFIVFSCSGNSSETVSDGVMANYRLEIFDSLQFDILTRSLIVADVDEKTGNRLIIQSGTPKVWIYNANGEVLAEKEFLKSDPEGPGDYLMSGTFFGDGVALLGKFAVVLLDEELQFEKVLRPQYSPSQMHFIGKKHIYQFTKNDNQPALITYFGEAQTDLWGGIEGYFDEFNLVDVVEPELYTNPRDSVFLPFGDLTPDSRYRNGKAHYFLRPVFDLKDNLLHYVLNTDTTFFRRNLPDGDIVDSYTIPYDEFVFFDGYSMGSAGEAEQYKPRNREGRVESVFRVGEFDLILYYSGMELSAMEKYRNSPDAYEQIERSDYLKYLIVKDGKRVNKELKMNPKVNYLEYADHNEIIYGMQNISMLDEEPERYTIYMMRIVADE